MSIKFEDWELENIYVVTQQSDAQKLVEEKNKTLYDMDRTRTPSSKAPTPVPKPKGDIRITKTDKTETISKEENEKRKEQVSNEYDKKIKEEIIKTAQDKDYDEETIQQIKSMPEKDLSVLTEKGVEGYREFEKQQELENIKNEKESDFSYNQQDIQKNNVSDFRENKDSLDITMDDEKSRELFGNQDFDQKENNIRR